MVSPQAVFSALGEVRRLTTRHVKLPAGTRAPRGFPAPLFLNTSGEQVYAHETVTAWLRSLAH